MVIFDIYVSIQYYGSAIYMGKNVLNLNLNYLGSFAYLLLR